MRPADLTRPLLEIILQSTWTYRGIMPNGLKYAINVFAEPFSRLKFIRSLSLFVNSRMVGVRAAEAPFMAFVGMKIQF